MDSAPGQEYLRGQIRCRLQMTALLLFCPILACTRVGQSPSPVSAYPIAVDVNKVGTYPALTKSGGGYFYDEVLEYRVWINPPEGGDDYFKAFPTYEEAITYSTKTTGADEPLVLILQREWIDEPQPEKYLRKTGERITEWQVKWLAGNRRVIGSIERFLQERSRAANTAEPKGSAERPQPITPH